MDELPRRELFDEELYLQTFPDIALAVREGEFSSGYEHWARYGRFELACSQRVAGSTFLLTAIGHGVEGSGAGDDPAIDDPSGNQSVGGASLVVVGSDSAQKQHAGCKPAKRPRRGGQSGNAEAGYFVGDELRVKPSPTHRDAEMTRIFRNLMTAGDIAGATAVLADAVDAAGPSDSAVLLLAFGIFRRAHFPPGRLIAKALQARLTDAQYRSLVTTWTEYCRAGLSEAEVESFLTAVTTDRGILHGTPGDRSIALNDRLLPLMLATMIGSIRLRATVQIRVFHHLRKAVIHEPADPVRSRIWPILQPALDDYLKVVSACRMLGDSSDLASLATEFATSLFREFHEQNAAERVHLVRRQSEQERDRLLAEVQRNPEDARSVLFLAETYFQMGDFADARSWCTRRIEMGGDDEEIYWALLRLAAAMAELDEPWPDVEDAYLRAWIFRPTRAEALHAIAVRYRLDQRYRLGYLFAHQAAEIPFPGEDLFVLGYFAEIYAWRALDEQAVCARWAGKHAEAFALCRRLVALPDIPDCDRQRIATNRDYSVPAMLEAATPYPEAVVRSLIAEPGDAQITVTLIAGPDRQTTEQTLNSFLTCCLDVSRVGRFLVLDTGLSAPDRAKLRKRYGFLEFARRRSGDKPAAQLAQLRALIDGPLWLHLGQGWQFFAPENLISRLTAVLKAQPQVFQVGINFADATTLTGTTAIEDLAHRTPDAGRYAFTEALAHGPAMFDTTRLNPAVGPHGTKPRTASLDEVLCIQPLSNLRQQDQQIPAPTQLAPKVVGSAYPSKAARPLNQGLSGMRLTATPIVDVKPVAQMPFHDFQIWSTTGIDPSFQLHLPPGSTRIRPGWYVLSVALRPTAGRLSRPKLYRDHGDGFREQDSDILVLADNTTNHRLLIKVERPIYALRLDPSDSYEVSEFLLGSLRIRRVSPQEARDEAWLRTVHEVCVALHRGPRGALKNLYRSTHEGTDYSEWIKTHDTLGGSLRAQIRADIDAMEERPLISIILPVYNTPERWLRACLDSVRNQLYGDWELCIADDASTEPHVRSVLREYAAKDNRIKVVFRKKNGHISAASNSALELASGNYVALLDHDDVLSQHALFHVAQTIIKHPEARLIYSDEDKIDETGKRFDPYFKPDWNPILFCGHNMLTHLVVYSLALVRDVGGFRAGWEGGQDYDLAFRCIERVEREQIVHIPHVLYHWRAVTGSTALGPDEKNYAHIAARKSINAHFERQGVEAFVTPLKGLVGTWRLSYQLRKPEPSVSIIIPTRNGGEILRRCISSIRERTDYSNYEIVIVNNQSDEQNTIDLLEREGRRRHQRVIVFDEPFNFSRLNNTAAKQSAREILVFLNDDTEVITAGWLRELVSLAIQPGVGAVGAMLYYPDDHIQHAGVILGLGAHRVAGHAYHRKARGYLGDKCRALLVQEMSAVTAACMAIKRDRFEAVRGFDESFAVAFNDVDLCLRLSQEGYRNVWTPNAELYHYESLTRGYETTPAKRRRFEGDCDAMRARWGDMLLHDPYYHPVLSLDQADFITYSSPRN
jgi:GT2 family glycosyltransferase/tetratricopeptide (TPR) repeat protein